MKFPTTTPSAPSSNATTRRIVVPIVRSDVREACRDERDGALLDAEERVSCS